MSTYQVYRVWRQDLVVDESDVTEVNADSEEEAAEQYMQDRFNNDPAVDSCIVMVNGEIYDCMIVANPVSIAHRRTTRKA